MTALITYNPIANVTVEDDGSLTLEIDWRLSCIGEWDEARVDHIMTPLAERVCDALTSLPGVTAVQVAGPGTVIVEPEPEPEPEPADPKLAVALALDDWLDTWSNSPEQPLYYAAVKAARDAMAAA